MRSRQRGATALGMITIVAIVGLGLYGVIRVVPLYLEYMAVVRALEQTAKDGASSQKDIRNALARRWTVEDIKSLDSRDIEIKRAGSGFAMRAWYRAEAPFISNISLVVDFDKTVNTGGAMAGT